MSSFLKHLEGYRSEHFHVKMSLKLFSGRRCYGRDSKWTRLGMSAVKIRISHAVVTSQSK